ncbi:hypothetical protein HDU97_007433 [Phlyctochytrium planicorne]|nr:hypothetical protein HDU97_007433 [Phlyctochytrium planicorne]
MSAIPTPLSTLLPTPFFDPEDGLYHHDPADDPAWYKPVGITLALTSGFFIGSSFIFKKRGLLDSQRKHGEIGHGHSYLKSPLWWTGMILMASGEVANFGAYAFVPAILVTPLGALSVVLSAILSSIFLKERLNFAGKIGCAQCLLGATIIVIHAPESNATETIPEFLSYVFSPGFGSSVVYTTRHWDDGNQFLQWPIYPLILFIIFTVCVQIHFLNKSLNQFSTAIVTPVYYVFFTTMTLISSAVLFRGFAVESAIGGVSLVFGFLVIVGGVSLLFQGQMEKKNLKGTKCPHCKVVIDMEGGVAAHDDEEDDEEEENGVGHIRHSSAVPNGVSAKEKALKLGAKPAFKVLASSSLDDEKAAIVDLQPKQPSRVSSNGGYRSVNDAKASEGGGHMRKASASIEYPPQPIVRSGSSITTASGATAFQTPPPPGQNSTPRAIGHTNSTTFQKVILTSNPAPLAENVPVLPPPPQKTSTSIPPPASAPVAQPAPEAPAPIPAHPAPAPSQPQESFVDDDDDAFNDDVMGSTAKLAGSGHEKPWFEDEGMGSALDLGVSKEGHQTKK